MEMYSKKFQNVLNEQDLSELDTDKEAFAAQLDPGTAPEDYDTEPAPQGATGAITQQQQQMFSELSSWITRMDDFADFMNGVEGSMQSSLNSAEPDTLFDVIGSSETKKIARVAMEISSLSEILKGYLASSNNPRYKGV
jgi:hypothetical protein